MGKAEIWMKHREIPRMNYENTALSESQYLKNVMEDCIHILRGLYDTINGQLPHQYWPIKTWNTVSYRLPTHSKI